MGGSWLDLSRMCVWPQSHAERLVTIGESASATFYFLLLHAYFKMCFHSARTVGGLSAAIERQKHMYREEAETNLKSESFVNIFSVSRDTC